MKEWLRRILPALLVLSVSVGLPINVLADDWTFGTLPADGTIFGTPGETIGWGYTLANESSTDWLWAIDVQPSSPFEHGIASSMPFDYPVLAPGASVMVPYDGSSGLANLTWDASAPAGFINSGTFAVSALWFDGDPFGNGNLVADAGFRQSAYQAVVSAAVPEVSGWTYLLCLLGTCVYWTRRQRTRDQVKRTATPEL